MAAVAARSNANMCGGAIAVPTSNATSASPPLGLSGRIDLIDQSLQTGSLVFAETADELGEGGPSGIGRSRCERVLDGATQVLRLAELGLVTLCTRRRRPMSNRFAGRRSVLWFVVVALPLFRHLLVAAGAAVLIASCGQDPAPTVRSSSAPTGADALPSLRREANELLGGGPQAFRARLAGLRGHPVVVNQWASWCGPCRHEFPFFARLARRYEGRVAFLGVNSKDSEANARSFLKRYPVPYPHFADPDGDIARVFRGGRAFPTTAFYAADGALAFTRLGGYATEAKLDADIRRYADG